MYKTLLLISVIFLSCSNDESCDKQLKELEIQYHTSLQNAIASNSAMNEVTNQYNIKKQNILKNCK